MEQTLIKSSPLHLSVDKGGGGIPLFRHRKMKGKKKTKEKEERQKKNYPKLKKAYSRYIFLQGFGWSFSLKSSLLKIFLLIFIKVVDETEGYNVRKQVSELWLTAPKKLPLQTFQ